MSTVLKNDLNEPLLPKQDIETKASSNDIKNTSRLARFFGNYYLYTGVLVALCYGSHNFVLYVSIGHALELRMLYLIQLAHLIFYFMYHIQYAIESKQMHGSFWSKSRSAYYKDDGTLNKLVLFIIFVQSLLQYVSQYVLYYILETSVRSGVSNSIILSIQGTTSILTAIAFYLVFNEKLGKRHVVGIAAVTLSIVLIATGRYEVDGNTISQNAGINEADRLSVLIPVSLQLFNCCIFAAHTLIARVVNVSRLSIYQYAADSQSLASIALTLQALFQQLYFEPYTLYEFSMVFLSSLLLVLGFIIFVGSAAYGKGGLLQAILMIQSPFQMLLEIVFLQLYPAILGVFGMMACLLGVLFIILTKN
ncbi:UNKNOWN [Stylonychia lemnae]|uniref:EamA domain-containing protein n=1 Tax=Stylonychia lemnae TaxID=5949 RepID=A0A078AER9_STYLE|nr:UNKNOWN [Stylonychia lemnae]|eukprot:CDW79992.1 UNKNOWN [Stylonychia lemnae]